MKNLWQHLPSIFPGTNSDFFLLQLSVQFAAGIQLAYRLSSQKWTAGQWDRACFTLKHSASKDDASTGTRLHSGLPGAGRNGPTAPL